MSETFPFELLPRPIWEFVGLCSEVTEAPDEFLVAGGLFVISVLSGRWTTFNGQSLNDYYLLVGDTGTAKKSTAQDLSIKLLRDTLEPITNIRIHLPNTEDDKCQRVEGPLVAYPLVTHFSIEGLQQHAIGSGTSTGITMGEYGTLFKIDSRQGQQNTITELTNMFDGRPLHVTTVQRRVEVSDYTLSLIAGSTRSWLGEFVGAKNIGGGFVNRHLVFTGVPARVLPTRAKMNSERWDALIAMFRVLIPKDLKGSLQGNRITWQASQNELTWNPTSQKIWEDYYRQRILETRGLSSESQLSELSARELTHATKLAGIRCCAEQRKEILVDDLIFGVRAARWAVRNTIELVKPHKYFSNRTAQKILEKIENFKPIGKTELAKKLGGKQSEINTMLEHLIMDGFVTRLDDGNLVPGASTLNYRNSEIEKCFGKSTISNFIEKVELSQPLDGGSSKL